MRFCDVEILEKQRFGNHVLFRYGWDGASPEPGQFVMVRPAAQTLDPFLSRPFFAHDFVDGVSSLLLQVRGRGTRLLAEQNSRLLVSAPLGCGFTLEDEGLVALIGGGVWISPLKLLSRRLGELGVLHDVFLEVPSNSPEAYVEWLSHGYPHAELVHTEGSSMSSRAVLDRAGELARYRALYASGPEETLIEVKEASDGLVPAQLALRERMACANGSCYGCAVPVWGSGGVRGFSRACIEGPVFPARTLAW